MCANAECVEGTKKVCVSSTEQVLPMTDIISEGICLRDFSCLSFVSERILFVICDYIIRI